MDYVPRIPKPPLGGHLLSFRAGSAGAPQVLIDLRPQGAPVPEGTRELDAPREVIDLSRRPMTSGHPWLSGPDPYEVTP